VDYRNIYSIYKRMKKYNKNVRYIRADVLLGRSFSHLDFSWNDNIELNKVLNVITENKNHCFCKEKSISEKIQELCKCKRESFKSIAEIKDLKNKKVKKAKSK